MVASSKTYIVPGHYRLNFLAYTEVQAEDITQGDLSSSTCGCDSGNCRTAIKHVAVIILFDLCFIIVSDSRLSLPNQAAMVILFRCDYRGFLFIGL